MINLNLLLDVKWLKKFLSRYYHWIFVIFIAICLILDFVDFTYSKQDKIAVGFGVIGLVGAAYIAFHVVVWKRRQQDLK